MELRAESTPVLIRHADPAMDAAACAAIYAPFVRDTFVTFEETPPDAVTMAERMESITTSHPWVVAEDSGDVVGYAYAGWHRPRPAYRWTAETTVYVDPAHVRRGIGGALYRELLAILAAQHVRNVVAVITLPNAPSVALHEACGYEAIGVYRRAGWKAGGWRDVSWWSRSLGAGAHGPPEELLPPPGRPGEPVNCRFR
jgi:phosphinothricin acetyltransferase